LNSLIVVDFKVPDFSTITMVSAFDIDIVNRIGLNSFWH